MRVIILDTQNVNHQIRFKYGDPQPTTKSILESYSGNILDISNGKEKILDPFKTEKIYQKNLKNFINVKKYL